MHRLSDIIFELFPRSRKKDPLQARCQHTHARTHTRTRARARAHTHTHTPHPPDAHDRFDAGKGNLTFVI